jgi:hypothetical protein
LIFVAFGSFPEVSEAESLACTGDVQFAGVPVVAKEGSK